METLSQQYLYDFYMKNYITIPKEEVDRLEQIAIVQLNNVCKDYHKICLGYSMGKDSIVINNIMEKTSIKYTPVCWRTQYQFSMQNEWFDLNKPKGTQDVKIERPTWEDLRKHESLLLFQENSRAGTICMQYKWQSQKKYLVNNGFDLFVTGRRKSQRNNCGSKKNNFIVKGKNYDTFNPLSEWSTEMVLAYIRYNALSLPPQYLKTPNGMKFGSIAWTERQRYEGYEDVTIHDRWEEVYAIEKDIVIEASKYLPSAKKFIEEKANEN